MRAKTTWNKYGKVAIETTRHVPKTGEHPRKVWKYRERLQEG